MTEQSRPWLVTGAPAHLRDIAVTDTHTKSQTGGSVTIHLARCEPPFKEHALAIACGTARRNPAFLVGSTRAVET